MPWKRNPRLVRGLDYYRHTAFEFVTDRLGAQGTVIAGGRYDGLIESLGGPHTPAVGWAAGIERLAMMIEAPAVKILTAMSSPGEQAQAGRAKCSQTYGASGIAAEGLSKAIEEAARPEPPRAERRALRDDRSAEGELVGAIGAAQRTLDATASRERVSAVDSEPDCRAIHQDLVAHDPHLVGTDRVDRSAQARAAAGDVGARPHAATNSCGCRRIMRRSSRSPPPRGKCGGCARSWWC